jgi:hypothetical protein
MVDEVDVEYCLHYVDHQKNDKEFSEHLKTWDEGSYESRESLTIEVQGLEAKLC